MERSARIWVAGSDSLIGAALVRVLRRAGHERLAGGPGAEPDLTDAAAVDGFVARERPEYVFVVGGKSGGIEANQRFPADLMLENLLAGAHVVRSAHRHGVRKLLYLASSCSYPKHCPQPMRVEALMTGPLEPTNEAYAVAKLAGLTLCRAFHEQHGARFVSAIPADAFGPGDDFGLDTSHVVPALIRRMHEAGGAGVPAVAIWGTGAPRREFIFADDLAGACLFAMRAWEGPAPINLGGGADVSIGELAAAIKEVVGYPGALVFDPSRPDGMPRKLLDSRPLRDLGWSPSTPLRDGLAATYDWFLHAIAASEGAPVAAAGRWERP